MATRYVPIPWPIDMSALSPLARDVADFFRVIPTATPLNAAQRFNRDMIDVVEAIEEIRRASKR